MVMSLTLPGESSKTRGRPRVSLRAWILVVRPPRERSMTSANAPFSATRQTMRPEVPAVDRAGVDHRAAPGQRLEDAEPDASAAPPVEPIVDSRVRPVDLRAVAPARTATRHMDDAADHSPVSDAVRAPAAARQQRLDPRPLFVVSNQ